MSDYTWFNDDGTVGGTGLPPDAEYNQVTGIAANNLDFNGISYPYIIVDTPSGSYQNDPWDQTFAVQDANGGYTIATPDDLRGSGFFPEGGIPSPGLGAGSMGEPLFVAIDPNTGLAYDINYNSADQEQTTIPATNTIGNVVAGGGGSGGGGGYTTTTSDSTGYSGPQVMYADGWIPPFFGGKYTRAQWLAMQYPDNGSSGPAKLPQLPKSFNLDVFGGSTPGNPFTSGGYGGGYGGYGGYGKSSAPDPSQLPLAKRLYQKFSNLRQQVTPGAPPTQSEYDQAQRQQQRDYRRNENEYKKYQASLSMRSNPLLGLERYIGQDRYQGPEYDLYSKMPLTGLQYLLNSKAKAKQFDDPKKYQKQLQQMYRQIDQSSEGWNYDKMMKGIWGGGKNSAVASLFQQRGTPEARYDSNGMYTGMSKGKSTGSDPTSQMYAMGNLLDGVYRTTMDPATAATWSAYADRQMAHWANRQYRKNPNNYGDIRKYMRGRVL